MSSSSSTPEAGQTQIIAKRAEVRKRCFLAATISFNRGLTTCECMIRNLSEGGARLDVNSDVSLPTFFHLSIPVQDKRLYAELKWRSENEAGIQFCDEEPVSAASKQTVEVDAALKLRIRELEAEVLQLRNRITQLTEG